MNAPRPASSRNPIVMPLVAANLGVLVTLFFGPNSGHAFAPAAYGGAALALAGLLAIVRVLIVRRRSEPPGADPPR